MFLALLITTMIIPGTTSFELTNNYKFLPTINPLNDPSEKPVIDNPKKVHVNTEYEFHVSSFDPNYDHIYFKLTVGMEQSLIG